MIRNQLLQHISLEFKEFFREPGIIFWAILFPILMAWGLGIAFTQKGTLVKNVALVELEGSAGHLLALKNISEPKLDVNLNAPPNWSVKLGSEKVGYTTYNFQPVSWYEALRMLKKGKTEIILESGPGGLNYHFDPLNPEAQLTYLQLLSALDPSKQDKDRGKGKVVPLTQSGTRYIDFLIPGLLAMGVMMSCMWGISYSLIDKRAKKLLRRMVATPMKKSMFLWGQFLARLSLGFFEAGLLIAFAYFYFGVVIDGDILALVIIFISGNLAFTGLAILVSSRTSKPQVGNGMINAVVMPMMVVSGVFFSYHNFPDWAISFIQVLPLTLLADSIRSVFIEGAGLAEIWFPALILSSVGVMLFSAGLRMYKWY